MKKKKFSFDGVSVNYIESGNGQVLIFLPGWGTRPQTYTKALDLMSKNYHIISPELPGFSSFEPPRTIWNFEGYGRFFSAFLDSLQTENVILVGQSLGGGIALYTASQNKKVKKLILIDAFGTPSENNRVKLSLLYVYQLLIESLDLKLLNTTLNNISNFCKNIGHPGYVTRFTLSILNKQIGIDISILQSITIPTTILWGDRDTLFGKQTARTLQESLPNSSLFFVTGTHNWVIFHPEHLNSFL